MSILIIDDEPGLRRSLTAHLEDQEYETLEAANGLEGLNILLANREAVKAVVVDLNMPVMDGYSFIGHATQEAPEVPIIVLSGVGIVEDALSAMRMGAWDFITKPLHNLNILDYTLDKVFDRARLLRENKQYQENLERLVRERTKELEETRKQVMQRLSRAAEYKDNETGRHVIRVGQISRLLGRAMGMDEDACELLGECAPLHDVGKIGIPDEVLLKPGKLTPDEWDTMRKHCIFGCEILGPLDSKDEAHRICSDPLLMREMAGSEQLKLARVLALCHHERWDGKGYPFGLSGDDIPLEARIVTVVDVFDALCSDRPYKQAMDPDKAGELIRAGAGTQFDAAVVEAFFLHQDEINAIRHRWSD
ncbi:MAG: response regulator [Humidesulfovibrio sp.]|uniref:HD-GYP domain-containing protein n=1 Tax=Humidesulfovibrio sp. TaxID=2910988 RepID=UPI002733B33F|nr:HD domain-containing phosphohydrolase [Humidesulfovibrio sp.]MDP2848534.1 response regulator [Humidesulfovibrio sp.]